MWYGTKRLDKDKRPVAARIKVTFHVWIPIMLFGRFPSSVADTTVSSPTCLIFVYISVSPSLPWFQPPWCHETGLWPPVPNWPLTLFFHISIHTRSQPCLHLKNAVQDAAGLTLKEWKKKREQREMGYEWFDACLVFMGDSQLDILSSVCFFSFVPLFHSFHDMPMQQFPIKTGPKHGGGPSFCYV